MPRVTTTVAFTFDTDEFVGAPLLEEFDAQEQWVSHLIQFAVEITEAFLHGDADMPNDHKVIDGGVEIHTTDGE